MNHSPNVCDCFCLVHDGTNVILTTKHEQQITASTHNVECHATQEEVDGRILSLGLILLPDEDQL